jgi:hypothetical protein
VLPPLGTGLPPVSPGITPAFSLRAHAPDLNPLTASVSPLCPESLQVAARPCWKEAVPGVISANPSPGAWTLTRSSRRCACSFLHAGHRPSPFPHKVGTTQNPTQRLPCGAWFSGLQSFTHVQAPGFARHPGHSHRQSGSLDPPGAAVTFASTQNSVRYLPEQWIC